MEEAAPAKPRAARVEEEDHVTDFVKASGAARCARRACVGTPAPMLHLWACSLLVPCRLCCLHTRSLCRRTTPQARRRGQLNAVFVAGAAAGRAPGGDAEDVYKTAAAVDAATGKGGARVSPACRFMLTPSLR